MPPIEIALSLIQLATKLAPQVQADLASGTVTPEQQAALQAAVVALNQSGFTGPQWQVQADPAAGK